jgi:hypothetical protein
LAGGQQSVETAQQLAQTPFDIPTQPIAGFSPQQLEALQTVENTQGMTNPFFTGATQLEAAGAFPNIGQYFGAETAGVVPEMENIFGQQMAQATGNWQQQAGGIGADRIGVAQAELANQQGLAAGQTLSQIMQNAVSQSQAGAGLEQQAGMNIGALGTAAQNAQLQGATAELQAGTLEQQQAQNQANAQYENILQQISWPFQTNQYLGSMSAGVTPAMGGMGLTSGNTKSSMMNTSGVGKGLGALGGKMGQGGSVPWIESPSTVPEDISSYDTGGRVDPLAVALGREGPLQDGGPSAFERTPMQGGGFLATPFNTQDILNSEPGGGFSPMTGRTIMVPYGPDFGGPQPLTLTGGAGQPPPNIHPGDFHFDTNVAGLDKLQLRGAASGPFQQQDSKNSSPTPFDGLLAGLMKERGDLMGKIGATAAMGPSGGLAGWMPALPSAGWAGKQDGGAVRPNEVGSIIFGATTHTPDDTNPMKVQKQSSGEEVGPLLGSSRSGVPAIGDKTVIPRSSVSGHPSPMMKDLMTNKQGDPMKLAQSAMNLGKPGGGTSQDLRNIFTPRETQDEPPQPSAQSTTSDNPYAAPGVGGKTAAPADSAALDATEAAEAGPEVGMAGAGAEAGADIGLVGAGAEAGAAGAGAAVGAEELLPLLLLAADGGAIPMQDGGDPLTLGMDKPQDTPYTPRGEISSQILPYSIASNIYNQPPQQMAGLDMRGEPPDTPFQPQNEEPQPPPGMGSPGSPTLPSPYPGTQLPGAVGQQPTGFKPQWQMTNPFRPGAGQPGGAQQNPNPMAPAAPITGPTPTELEQKAIGELNTVSRPSIGQPPQQTPAAPTQAPGATPPPAQPVPPKPAGAASAFPQQDTKVADVIKATPALQPYASFIPDQDMNVGQWAKAHPDLIQRFGSHLPPAMRQALQSSTQPQTQARPGAQPPARNADAQAIIDSANRLKMDPRMLAAILDYESRFNPKNVNSSGKGYPVKGLIGFDPENVRKYGEPAPTIAQQMPQVERYMLDRGWKPGVFAPNDLARAYSIINAGSLDRSGNPRLEARDINGNVAHHIATIERDSYGPADKFLYGKEGEYAGLRRKPTAEEPEGRGPETVSRETPAPGTSDRYAKPPGFEMPSAARKFLYTLATGDPTLALKEKAMELGLYQQAADWDAARNMQYGSMTPQAAGAAALNEAHATRQLLGAAGGAPEEAGEPGTISHAAATGRSPAGASVAPVGGGAAPSGIAASAPAGVSSAPAGASPPPRNLTEQAVDRALTGIASGNPKAMAAGNASLSSMAQRGLVDAETIKARIEAAKMAGPVVIPGMGPARYDPTTGAVVPFTPGMPSLPGVLPPPAPGSLPAGVRQVAPAPGPVAPPPPPAGGMPTPLPSGAEPRPTPGATPAASAVQTDPAFNARANAPRSSAEMFNDPNASEFARDERAWTDTGKQMIKEETAAAVKDARGHLDADRQADVMLAELEENLEKLPKGGVLAPGPTMQIRNHIVGLYNDLARISAPALGKDALPQVAPATVGSVEQINKLANTLAFALARTLGSREAVQIVQQARNSVPSADVSPAGARYILQNLRAGIAMDRDYYNGLQNWASSNLFYGNSIKGFDDWFAATHPAQMYAMRAAALAARDDNDKPIDREALDLLKTNPGQVDKFERHFHTPGLGRYYLQQQGATP